LKHRAKDISHPLKDIGDEDIGIHALFSARKKQRALLNRGSLPSGRSFQSETMFFHRSLPPLQQKRQAALTNAYKTKKPAPLKPYCSLTNSAYLCEFLKRNFADAKFSIPTPSPLRF
jgi:hypothetical protein